MMASSSTGLGSLRMLELATSAAAAAGFPPRNGGGAKAAIRSIDMGGEAREGDGEATDDAELDTPLAGAAGEVELTGAASDGGQ